MKPSLPAAVLLSAALSCAGSGPIPFESPRDADHPLVGHIHAMREGQDLRWSDLVRRARTARFVLLGEIHDNADHHRLQARLLTRLAAEGPPPAVVFEMLASDRQEAVDAFRASGGRDPDLLAERVDWTGSGWPDFDLYRPVFAAALDAGLPLLAAGLPRGEPPGGGDPAWRERFGLDAPLPATQQAARIEEMYAGHCELVPRERLGPMVEIQRARDAQMADALLRGARLQGRAVLVAGAGHVERRGVPAALARAGVPEGEIFSVGFLEVDPKRRRIEEVDGGDFDVVMLTPGAEREDPCEGLRRRLAS